jgi:hypothetical protein
MLDNRLNIPNDIWRKFMNELLIFEEILQKPTDNGKNYEPYFATKIEIENATSIIVTCHDKEDAAESIDCLKSLKTSNFVLGEEEFSYATIKSLNPTQFRITGDLTAVMGELVRSECISNSLKEKILQNKNFIQLISAGSSESKTISPTKSKNPQLWEKIESLTIEEKKQLLEDLTQNIQASQTMSGSTKRPGSVTVK